MNIIYLIDCQVFLQNVKNSDSDKSELSDLSIPFNIRMRREIGGNGSGANMFCIGMFLWEWHMICRALIAEEDIKSRF